ncbi:complement C1q and tumor necrosis factor-related protein 9A-like [Glandiceps talaboti]
MIRHFITMVACLTISCLGEHSVYREMMERSDPVTVNDGVAFSVGLTDTFGPFSVDTTIFYDKVFVNTNEVFNRKTGTFTVPISGFYFLTVNIQRGDTGDEGPVVTLYINDNYTNSMFRVKERSINDDVDSATNNVILQLKAGDLVKLVLSGNNQNLFSHLSSFTGFLIFESCSF